MFNNQAFILKKQPFFKKSIFLKFLFPFLTFLSKHRKKFITYQKQCNPVLDNKKNYSPTLKIDLSQKTFITFFQLPLIQSHSLQYGN